ncbi:hypothetical protein K525DRAFT_261656 [Schizophyllum commune Loenen D]|nr:hypothetical protein K525DRAFT_261656 [Schizophyllum commune Loenen D]
MAACLRFTRRVMNLCLSFYSTLNNYSQLNSPGHDAQCFPNLSIVSAKPGEVVTSLKIEQYNLHGGLIMSLTDTLGSLAVATKGHWMTGVSTDIGTSFVRPGGKIGDHLHARAVLTGLGKSLAYTRVDFTNAKGELVAYGHHTKYVGKSGHHDKNVTFTEDGETVVHGEDLDVD